MPTKYKTDDLRIKAIKEVVAPAEVLAEHPISDTAAETTATTRRLHWNTPRA